MAAKSSSTSFLTILVVLSLIGVGGLLALVFNLKQRVATLSSIVASDQTKMVNVTYKCDADREVSVMYMNGATNSVTVNLPNNNSFNLMQTMSADGGRYANWDNSFVFWTRGNSAFIEQNGNTTYDNCTQTSSN